jgi:hypothetical protein
MDQRLRPAAMRPIRLVLAAAVLALTTTTLSATTALACTCRMGGLGEMVAAADVAFIGTVVGEREPDDMGTFEPATYAFDVAMSKAPLPNPFEMDSTYGIGANCGFDMTVGEEWLVIASEWEGRLETNLCTGSTRTEFLDPPELERIKLAMAPNDPPAVPEDPGFSLDVSAPVIGILAAAVLVGAVGVVAFRRDRVS